MKIFFSYRRKDSQWQVDKLFDTVTGYLSGPDHSVFFDQKSIRGGEDFPKRIETEIQQSDCFLAIIGGAWNSKDPNTGRRRLDDENDWVRKEVEIALMSDIRIIPVFIDVGVATAMSDLPQSLSQLSRLNGHKVRYESFDTDVAELMLELGVERKVDPEAYCWGLRSEVSAAVKEALLMEAEALRLAEKARHFLAMETDIRADAAAKRHGYRVKRSMPLWGSENIHGLQRANRFDGPCVIDVVRGPNVGDYYVGERRAGFRNGLGTYFWANGTRYEGQFANDVTNGIGIYYWTNESSYAGQQLKDQQHGYGVRRIPDGTRYEGMWAYGKRDGFGVLRNADGSIQQQGFFRFGTLLSQV